MAYPYIFEANFEGGSNAEWDSETDTGSLLNFPHYTKLSGYNASVVGPIAPWRGAYLAEWNLGDTNDHTLIASAVAIANTVTAWTRFYLFLGKDLTGVTDIFNIFELQGTANAVENAIGLRITTGSNVVEIGIGQTAPSVFATQPLMKCRFYCVEMKSVIQSGGTGTIDLYVDGALVQSVTTLTNTAVLRGVLGTQDTLSTTTGHVFISGFCFDDARVFPDKSRFPASKRATKSTHIFVGPGWIDSAAILSSSGSFILYDTDTANTDNAEAVVDLDQARGVTSYDGGAYFARGCYASITSAIAEVKLLVTDADRRRFGPQAYGSAGAIRQYGYRRSARNQNV